jgi:predicted DsbA family dithiol-disulfide isomerase
MLTPHEVSLADWLLIGAGLTVSVVSGLENRVRWIGRFCSFFGKGCRKTEIFRLLGLRVSWWGVLFYVSLTLAALAIPEMVRPLVMLGTGFELTFIWIMLVVKIFCIFCLFNALVILGLFLMWIDPGLLPASGGIIALSLLISSVLLWRENKDRIRPASSWNQGVLTLEGRPTIGPSDAPVTVVEFSDYLCPACRKAHMAVKSARSRFKGKVRWVFKDMPLPREGARELAAVVHCADDQDRFWEFQDLIYEAGRQPDEETMKRFAGRLGLDVPRFESCVSKRSRLHQVDQDAKEAVKAGITAVPTFLINGRKIVGAKSLRKAIDQALASAGKNTTAE